MKINWDQQLFGYSHSSKYLLLCSSEKSNLYRTTREVRGAWDIVGNESKRLRTTGLIVYIQCITCYVLLHRCVCVCVCVYVYLQLDVKSRHTKIHKLSVSSDSSEESFHTVLQRKVCLFLPRTYSSCFHFRLFLSLLHPLLFYSVYRLMGFTYFIC